MPMNSITNMVNGIVHSNNVLPSKLNGIQCIKRIHLTKLFTKFNYKDNNLKPETIKVLSKNI